jgi:hypothetical protein
MDDGLLRLGSAAHQTVTREEAWLLGQPPLSDYLSFVQKRTVGGGDPRASCDEWRRANDYYYELEETEAGAADQIDCHELGPEFIPLAEEVMRNPGFQRCFNTLPVRFAIVELDRLVAFQRHVTQSFIDALKLRITARSGPAELFRFCFPLDAPELPLEVRRVSRRRYMFTSDSADFRFQEAALLRGEQLRDYAAYGPIGRVLGLAVGFGSNFLNAIGSEKRLLLHNGYHRACALRELGFTHAPCIVQTVTRLDELAICADDAVLERPAFYFKAKRPPLLKDFYDPAIRKVLPVPRLRRVVELSFEVREFEVAE